MTTTFAFRAGAVGGLGAALLVLSGGCQSFHDMFAGDKPAPASQTSSPIANDTTPRKPITKEQKIEVQLAVARAAENDGNVEQAIIIYKDVIERDSRRIEAYHRLAIVYDTKGDWQQARKLYMTAITKAPKDAELYCDFGYSCYLQRNWAEASVNLNRALELRPEFARAHTNLGLLLARNYHATEALAEFTKAGCDEASARCNLAYVLTTEDRFADARQQYELALHADPNAVAAKRGLAALPSASGDVDVDRTPPPATANIQPPAGGTVRTLPPPTVVVPPPVAPQAAPQVAPQDNVARLPAPPQDVAPQEGNLQPENYTRQPENARQQAENAVRQPDTALHQPESVVRQPDNAVRQAEDVERQSDDVAPPPPAVNQPLQREAEAQPVKQASLTTPAIPQF